MSGDTYSFIFEGNLFHLSEYISKTAKRKPPKEIFFKFISVQDALAWDLEI